MEIHNIKTARQFQILSAVIDKAEEAGYTLDEYTQAGYNENSGYIWVWNEMEMYTLGIADYAYNRGEAVQFIINEPFEGEEFFGDTYSECVEQYNEWAAERLEAGEICESDIQEF
jgi:hypothetical protein